MSRETVPTRTHRVGVGAYIIQHGRLLLLKRAHPPFTFAPPGGKLEADEDPILGIAREVREETGLELQVLGTADSWFGTITPNGSPLLCINYVGMVTGDTIRLSAEHTDFVWASPQEIQDELISTVDSAGFGYRSRELLLAFEHFERLSA